MWPHQLTGMLCKRKQKRNEYTRVYVQRYIECETCNHEYADNNWGHVNSSKRFEGKLKGLKGNFGSRTEETFNRLTAKDS
jgi:hypothetical protein